MAKKSCSACNKGPGRQHVWQANWRLSLEARRTALNWGCESTPIFIIPSIMVSKQRHIVYNVTYLCRLLPFINYSQLLRKCLRDLEGKCIKKSIPVIMDDEVAVRRPVATKKMSMAYKSFPDQRNRYWSQIDWQTIILLVTRRGTRCNGTLGSIIYY